MLYIQLMFVGLVDVLGVCYILLLRLDEPMIGGRIICIRLNNKRHICLSPGRRRPLTFVATFHLK